MKALSNNTFGLDESFIVPEILSPFNDDFFIPHRELNLKIQHPNIVEYLNMSDIDRALYLLSHKGQPDFKWLDHAIEDLHELDDYFEYRGVFAANRREDGDPA